MPCLPWNQNYDVLFCHTSYELVCCFAAPHISPQLNRKHLYSRDTHHTCHATMDWQHNMRCVDRHSTWMWCVALQICKHYAGDALGVFWVVGAVSLVSALPCMLVSSPAPPILELNGASHNPFVTNNKIKVCVCVMGLCACQRVVLWCQLWCERMEMLVGACEEAGKCQGGRHSWS